MQHNRVAFCLVDDGWLHRAVDTDGDIHIIEELQMFDKPQPIESMVISSVQVIIKSHTNDLAPSHLN